MGLPLASVDICNMALDLIGQPQIASINPPSTNTESLCARWYDVARQMALRQFCWNFAKARAVCTRAVGKEPAFDFTDAYELPANFVRLLSVDGETEIEQGTDYDISERLILMNNDTADSVNLRYIKDVTDLSKWPADFRVLVSYYLALHIGYQITKKKATVEMIDALLKLYLPDAASVDGQEVPPKRIQRSKYLAARKLGISTMTDIPGYIYVP